MEQMVTSEQEATLRARIVAAVQAELDRHASAVAVETEKLRADALRERDDLHRLFGDQLAALTRKVDEMVTRNDQVRQELERQIAQHAAERASTTALTELEQRMQRRLENVTSSLPSLVDDAAKPHLTGLRDEQETLTQRVEVLDADLRKFDAQAARLVTYFNDLATKLRERGEQAADGIRADVEQRMAGVDDKIEEVSSASLRQHVETSKMVNERTERLEERLNVRVSTVEGSIREEVGGRIAEIDAHVGRVAAGLDETLDVLGDRMSALERTARDLEEQVGEVRKEVSGADSEVIEDLKEKVSSAAGEAMLVRIDLERLEKASGERVESMNARLVTVESQLADATMDVSTAVQLERLEELERAIMELAPPEAAGSGAGQDHDGQDHRHEGGPGAYDAPAAPEAGTGVAPPTGSTVDPASTEGLDLTALRLAETPHQQGSDHGFA